MKRLQSTILAMSIFASLMTPVYATDEVTKNPLSLEQTIVSEDFNSAKITRPVTNSNEYIRMGGTDGFAYHTTSWGYLSRQKASIEDGRYVHTFFEYDKTDSTSDYQVAQMTKKLDKEVPLNLGDELHIGFDYMHTNTISSNMSFSIDDLASCAFTCIENNTGKNVSSHANVAQLIAFNYISNKEDNKTKLRICGGESAVVIDPAKLYRVNLIIKTADKDYDNKETLTVNITADDGTDIRVVGYLDAAFKGKANQYGYISVADPDIEPLRSFKELTFKFETPSAAGDMVIDNVTVKKIRNGYDIKGDAVADNGVIPEGFTAGTATVSLTTDVSYYTGNSVSGSFIVAQYDEYGRFIDADITPATVTRESRVVSKEITINEKAKKLTAFFWGDNQTPKTAEENLAEKNEAIQGVNSDFTVDFTDLSKIEKINEYADSGIFTFGTETAGFGKSGETVYTIANNTDTITDSEQDKPYKAIKVSPSMLYPEAGDTTVFDISFAADALSSNKTVKVASYNEDGTKGEISELIAIKPSGDLCILNEAAKLRGKKVKITPEKWYNLKLYINKADYAKGTPNTVSAYLDGQLVIDNKAFSVNGDTFAKWYGFSDIEIGAQATVDNTSYKADKLYIGRISLGINNTAPVNTVIDSNNSHFVNLIDNSQGIIYNGGQDFDDFISYLKRDGITSAEFIENNAYLKLGDIKGGDIYYKVIDLPEHYVDTHSVSGVDTTPNIYNPDLTNYYEYEPPISIKKGSALDASFVLGNAETIDKNGFVYADGDRFMLDKNTPNDKSDDEEIKFWGTNIPGQGGFPDTHEEAERLADSVAAAGFNLVRFHGIESGRKPLLFGFTDDATKIDETSWEKFTYLLKCLKDRGIYYYIDQMIFMPASIYKNGVGNLSGFDDVTGLGSGLSPICYFNEHAIDLQQEFSRMLLTEAYPASVGHSKSNLVNDPALAMMDLKNEFSLQSFEWLEGSTSTEFTVIEKYKTHYEELCKLYTEWIKKKYPSDADGTTDEKLEAAWGKSFPMTVDGVTESSETSLNFFRTWLHSDKRLDDEEFFMRDMMADYYKAMLDYLKDTVGVSCAVTGNTIYGGSTPHLTHDNATGTDFIDAHKYWGHPASGDLVTPGSDLVGFNSTGLYTKAGSISMLDADVLEKKNSETGEVSKYVGNLALIGQLASAKVSGKPYVISEWLDCAGNPTFAEGVPIMAAMASMHNWTPISFGWSSDTDYFANVEDGRSYRLQNAFSIITNPVMRATFPAASVMFNRGDVAEATEEYYTQYNSDEEIYIGQRDSQGIWVHTVPVPNMSRHALLGKTGIKFYDVPSTAVQSTAMNQTAVENTEKELNGEKVTYTSTTGELITNLGDTIFKVNTPRSQVISGYVGGKAEATDNMSLDISSEFAAIMLTSIDGDKAISNADRILFTAAGNARNHGYLLTNDGGAVKIGSSNMVITLKDNGTKEYSLSGDNVIMIEQIVGTVTLKGLSGNNYKVYPLTPTGERMAELNVTKTADGISFTLTKDTKAMNLEIVKVS